MFLYIRQFDSDGPLISLCGPPSLLFSWSELRAVYPPVFSCLTLKWETLFSFGTGDFLSIFLWLIDLKINVNFKKNKDLSPSIGLSALMAKGHFKK